MRFLLSCLGQRVFRPESLAKLEEKLQAIAEREASSAQRRMTAVDHRAELVKLEQQLELVKKNLALAENTEHYNAISDVFEELMRTRERLATDVAAADKEALSTLDPNAEVAKALALLRDLGNVVSAAEDLGVIGELFRRVKVRLFLRFHPVKTGKRTVNRLRAGVVIFGSASPPVLLYDGPTDRKKLRAPAAGEVAEALSAKSPGEPNQIGSGREGDSLGNVSRGNWIRTSDLTVPNRAL